MSNLNIACAVLQHIKTALISILSFSILISSIYSCQPFHEGALIELNAQRTDKSQHLGDNVWIEVPYGYKRARTYDGFQNGKRSSISLSVVANSLSETKKNFDPQYLKKKKTVLEELHPVKFGTIDSAFFAVVYDKRKNTVRYLLACNTGLLTYNIKAFCFKPEKHIFDQKIRNALFSASFDEMVEKEELFKLASLESLSNVTLTKDGKHPTESTDGSTIEIESMDEIVDNDEIGLMKEALGKLVKKGKNDSPRVEAIANGKFYTQNRIGEEDKAFVALIALTNGQVTIIKCYGNKKASLLEFENYTRDNFLKSTILPR